MDLNKLVQNYISAWNQLDFVGVLALMHKSASYYDAFWRESCRGPDLCQYLHGSFDEERYWYRQVGGVIATENGVVYRYSAHERTNSKIGRAIYNGAEVITLRDSKIFTVSDYYCDPERTALKEIARLAAIRHGEQNYAKSGLSALKSLRFRNQLAALIDQDKIYLDPKLTMSQLAGQIGCSVDHLFQIINTEYGTNFRDFLDQHRARYARDLLVEDSDDKNYVLRVAVQAGFTSALTFDRVFKKSFGVTPTEFHCRHMQPRSYSTIRQS